jgi:hypothetical protein
MEQILDTHDPAQAERGCNQTMQLDLNPNTRET